MAVNISNNKIYIGKTARTLKIRSKQHYKDARYRRSKGKQETYFGKALLKYDENAFEWDILEDNISGKDALDAAEIFWIQYYKYIGAVLYNGTPGGDGQTKGFKHTDETKQKISVTSKGNKNALGHKPTDETKCKMSEIMKGNQYSLGHKHTPEAKAKISASLKGKKNSLGYKQTPEHKAKRAAAMKGNTNGKQR